MIVDVKVYRTTSCKITSNSSRSIFANYCVLPTALFQLAQIMHHTSSSQAVCLVLKPLWYLFLMRFERKSLFDVADSIASLFLASVALIMAAAVAYQRPRYRGSRLKSDVPLGTSISSHNIIPSHPQEANYSIGDVSLLFAAGLACSMRVVTLHTWLLACSGNANHVFIHEMFSLVVRGSAFLGSFQVPQH